MSTYCAFTICTIRMINSQHTTCPSSIKGTPHVQRVVSVHIQLHAGQIRRQHRCATERTAMGAPKQDIILYIGNCADINGLIYFCC